MAAGFRVQNLLHAVMPTIFAFSRVMSFNTLSLYFKGNWLICACGRKTMFNAHKMLWGQPIFLPDLIFLGHKPNEFDIFVCMPVNVRRQALHVLDCTRKIT